MTTQQGIRDRDQGGQPLVRGRSVGPESVSGSHAAVPGGDSGLQREVGRTARSEAVGPPARPPGGVAHGCPRVLAKSQARKETLYGLGGLARGGRELSAYALSGQHRAGGPIPCEPLLEIATVLPPQCTAAEAATVFGPAASWAFPEPESGPRLARHSCLLLPEISSTEHDSQHSDRRSFESSSSSSA